MSVNEAPRAATKPRLSLGIPILIAAAIIGFGVLHIVGDAVLRVPSIAAKADTAVSKDYGD
jgi:hypothetical protein